MTNKNSHIGWGQGGSQKKAELWRGRPGSSWSIRSHHCDLNHGEHVKPVHFCTPQNVHECYISWPVDGVDEFLSRLRGTKPAVTPFFAGRGVQCTVNRVNRVKLFFAFFRVAIVWPGETTQQLMDIWSLDCRRGLGVRAEVCPFSGWFANLKVVGNPCFVGREDEQITLNWKSSTASDEPLRNVVSFTGDSVCFFKIFF